MSYAGIQSIREGAGLQFRKEKETPAGVVDGTNKTFTAKRAPFVDTDKDDQVSDDDVTVYVGGVPVQVEEVQPVSGTVVLAVAPAAGQKVTIDYSFSTKSDDFIGGKQDEADDWINRQLKPYAQKGWIKLPLNEVPGLIATIAEQYAAGLILTGDTNARTDASKTARDGTAKIKLARELLADYIQSLVTDNQVSNADGGGSVSVISDRDIFARDIIDSPDIPRNLDDDRFMRSPGRDW